jgi:RNA polymerase sigma factor (sigma-70 family)
MGMTLALRVLSDEMLAEEALQDAFLRVWRSAHTFTFNSSFKTWFYRVLYNAALTKRKTESKSDEHVELDEHAAVGEDTTLGSKESSQLILESIERLPESQRTVLTLYYLQELSIEEIGEITGMPSGTIKTHLFRGREKLRNDVSLREYVNN